MYDLYIANKNYSSWSLRPWVLLVPCLVDGAIRSTRTKSAAMAPGAQTCGWDS